MARRPTESLVLAIDLGSSSVRTGLFTSSGRLLSHTMASRHYAIRYSAEGAAELDAAVLLRSTRGCIAETLRRSETSNIQQHRIEAVSGSAFWHSLLGLDARDRPITPVFTWTDSRSTADAERLRSELDERDVQLRTGCMLRAQFWPAKLRWLRRTNAALFRRVSRWTSPACWIFTEIFGVDSVSHSMASATGLYNLHTASWDEEMLSKCRLRADQLDQIANRAAPTKSLRQFPDVTIFSAIGDGAAGNLGSGADRPGSIAINFGTSGAVRCIQRRTSEREQALAPGLFRYVLDKNRDVVGGAISNAGNLYQWCVRELQAKNEDHALSRRAAAADALTVLPFLVNERAPDWPENLHGAITGLTQTTTAGDLLRATTTSTFYRLSSILELLTVRHAVKEVIVSGGIAQSIQSLRVLADSLGHDTRVSPQLESSLRGAAVYALEALGYECARLPAGKLIRHDPALAAKHRQRRAAQHELQSLLESS